MKEHEKAPNGPPAMKPSHDDVANKACATIARRGVVTLCLVADSRQSAEPIFS